MRFGYFSHVWGRPGTSAAARYAELWDEVELADHLGFDYAFSVEHHFTPDESWMSTPAVFCTGAAMRTQSIRIGAMGWVAPLHNPIRLVEEVASLDQVTGGRLEVGLAAGLTPAFFAHYGADFAHRKELTAEMVDLLRTALSTDGPFSFDGPVHTYRDVRLSFPAVQRPHPPLWIPTRDRTLLRHLAEIGAHTSSTMIVPRPALGVVYRHYVDWWRRAGHPGNPNIGYWTLVHVGDDLDRLAPHITRTLTETLGYGRTSEPVGGGVGRPSALSTEEILRRAGDIGFLLDHNLVFVGSADEVAQRIRSAAGEGMFNVLLGEFNFGGLSAGEVAESTKRFAAEVMPQLTDFEPF